MEIEPLGESPSVSTAQLATLGFHLPGRAESFLSGEAVRAAGIDPLSLAAELSRTAEPDLALLALMRLADKNPAVLNLRATSSDPAWNRFLGVLGASRWAGDVLISDPGYLSSLDTRPLGEPFEAIYARIEKLVRPYAAEGARRLRDGTAALRRQYRRELISILAADLELSAPSLTDGLNAAPRAAAAISNLVGATVNGALLLAQGAHPEAARYRFSVIAMGKTGGEELNYISDVDVLYVCDGPADRDVAALTTPLAYTLRAVLCDPSGPDAPLWPLDTNLRPEGKDGPLVRTLDSHIRYYERWAKTWEFQALLKARPIAGDIALGQEYIDAVTPLIWTAVERDNFVEDTRALRRRHEDYVRTTDVDRQLKYGRGGLRDVEFTIQLLQLVHGRTDPSVRLRGTLPALAALAAAGYVGRAHAAELAECYKLLRALEHRIQFDRMRRSHNIPGRPRDLRRLARLLHLDDVETVWLSTRHRVRELHEAIYYRPLLPLTARLTAQETSLEPAAATARLRAFGYRNPAGAMRHLKVMTEGDTRRAAIQRQLLPVMIGWFASGPNPDAGLLEYRKLSEDLSLTHWFLGLLRDSSHAAEKLAYVLASSAYCANALQRLPEAVTWLDDPTRLAPRPKSALLADLDQALGEATTREQKVAAIRYIRRRELTRAALYDVLSAVDPERSVAMTQAADVAVTGALAIARQLARERMHVIGPDPARFAVIAMGRMGGLEMNYSSDADLIYVYEPRQRGAGDQEAREFATHVAKALREALTEPSVEPPLHVDADLRPEGRGGAVVRSLEAYADYYERWSEPWEWLALLRARTIAGDEDLMGRFTALVDPIRYRAGGISPEELADLRHIKDRVETERRPVPRSETHHLKLGSGGLADIEFAIQVLQVRNAAAVPALRTTRTLVALEAAASAQLLSRRTADAMREAWKLVSRTRDAMMLVTDKAARSDVLPGAGPELSVVARVLGYASGTSAQFQEDYLRVTRRARRAVEEVF